MHKLLHGPRAGAALTGDALVGVAEGDHAQYRDLIGRAMRQGARGVPGGAQKRHHVVAQHRFDGRQHHRRRIDGALVHKCSPLGDRTGHRCSRGTRILGHHHDAQVRRACVQRLRELCAIRGLLQLDVHHEHVRVKRVEGPCSVPRRRAFAHLEPRTGDQLGQQRAGERIVFDDQGAAPVFLRRHGRIGRRFRHAPLRCI